MQQDELYSYSMRAEEDCECEQQAGPRSNANSRGTASIPYFCLCVCVCVCVCCFLRLSENPGVPNLYPLGLSSLGNPKPGTDLSGQARIRGLFDRKQAHGQWSAAQGSLAHQ